MANKELSDFVQQSLARGESKEQITTVLTRQGWLLDQINEAFGESGGMPVRSRKPLFVGIAVLVLLLIGGGVFALYQKKSGTNPSQQNENQLFVAGSGDNHFSFRYPKEYCAFEEGGVKVALAVDCNNPNNEKYLSISIYPTIGKENIDDFIKFFDSLLTDTGTRKTIGGFQAHEVNFKNSENKGWVFIIDKDTAVLINSQLGDAPGSSKAIEVILDSIAFGKNAELYSTGATPKNENFNHVGARAIGYIGRVDISPDDREIIFSYSHDGSIVNLYTANADGSNVKKIEPNKKPNRYFPIEPKYSHDGKKILFISRDQGLYGPKGIAYVMNRDGSDLRTITKDDENVLEAIFSLDNQAIYYLRSNSWRNYNGMAPDLPHEIDLYRVNLDGTGFAQLTTYKDYELKGLSLSPDGKLIGVGYRILSLQTTPPSIVGAVPCGKDRTTFSFYPNEKSYLCIDDGFDGLNEGSMFKIALEGRQNEWKTISPQKIYLYPPVFFHSKNTILFFEHDGAFPQKIHTLNLDEPTPTGSPVPKKDLRTKEVPLAIPKN